MDARYTGNLINARRPEGSAHALLDEQRDAESEEGDGRAFLARPFSTLGMRLDRGAHSLVSRRIPLFPWLRPLETTIEHLTSLPVPAQERFQRGEVTTTLQPVAMTFAFPGRQERWGETAPDDRQSSASHLQQRSPNETAGHVARSGVQDGNLMSAFASGGVQEKRAEPVREGQPLPSYLQQRLQTFVGYGAEAIRIHDDAASHTIARAQRADAVTIGQHIFFGQNRFRPQEDRGFALLAHEALHVVHAMRPGHAWRRATQAGIQQEEHEAETLERRVRDSKRSDSWSRPEEFAHSQPVIPAQIPMGIGQAGSQQHPVAAVPPGGTTEVPASALAQQPMRAATNRSLDTVPSSQAAMPDLEVWKRALYRDLMRQIKADLERGG